MSNPELNVTGHSNIAIYPTDSFWFQLPADDCGGKDVRIHGEYFNQPDSEQLVFHIWINIEKSAIRLFAYRGEVQKPRSDDRQDMISAIISHINNDPLFYEELDANIERYYFLKATIEAE